MRDDNVENVDNVDNVDNDDNDDDDDDEDYNPAEENNDDDDDENDHGGDNANGNSRILSCSLSEAKRKAVDEAFLEMFGYPFGTQFLPSKRQRKIVITETETTATTSSNPVESTNNHGNCATGSSTVTTISRTAEKLLIQIFGATVATQIMAIKDSRHSVHSAVKQQGKIGPSIVAKNPIPATTGRQRFAGQILPMTNKTLQHHKQPSPRIQDQTTNAVATAITSSTSTTTTTNTPSPLGLENLLHQLKGPENLSTVAKTSSDWDTFKEKAGVSVELEQQAQSNQAYLVQQEFLHRVDVRSFQLEMAQRELKRSK